MPISHITLRTGHTAEFLDMLSASLHEALVAQFNVPADDRFQVFHQLGIDDLRFDPHYLGGPRTQDWVLIEITAGKPRRVETKRTFYRDLADRLARSPGIDPADVMVVVRHNQPEDWSFSHGLTSMLEPQEITK
jgi:hypothetical protein